MNKVTIYLYEHPLNSEANLLVINEPHGGWFIIKGDNIAIEYDPETLKALQKKHPHMSDDHIMVQRYSPCMNVDTAYIYEDCPTCAKESVREGENEE